MQKAKPQNLSSSEDGTAGKRFNYTTTLSVKHCLDDNFFQTVKQNLMPGDEISVRKTSIKGRMGRMYEMLVVMVTEVTATEVKIEQIGDTLTFDHEETEEEKKAQTTEQYAREGWTYSNSGGPWFVVKNEKGAVVAEKLKKEDAILIVSGNKALPQKAA